MNDYHTCKQAKSLALHYTAARFMLCAHAFSVFLIMPHINVSIHVAHVYEKIAWLPTIRNWLAKPLGKWSTKSWHENLSLSTIAQNFSISVETAHNIVKCFILTGDITAKAPGPCLGSAKLSVREELFVIDLVLERLNIFLQAVLEEVIEIFNYRAYCMPHIEMTWPNRKVRQIALQIKCATYIVLSSWQTFAM